LAAEDPIALRATLAQAEAARTSLERQLQDTETALAQAQSDYQAAAESARSVRERDAEANRAWREQAAAVDRIREGHEQEDPARRDLQQVIREVDRQMAELFDEAFRDVSREFSGLFSTLFPGGEGRLILEDPADLLGTGIEIEARPGRKRVKRLSLLSGGERS